MRVLHADERVLRMIVLKPQSGFKACYGRSVKRLRTQDPMVRPADVFFQQCLGDEKLSAFHLLSSILYSRSWRKLPVGWNNWKEMQEGRGTKAWEQA